MPGGNRMRICPRCLIENCVIRPSGKDAAYCAECNRELCREWYKINRERQIRKIRKHQISTNYKTEKTPKQRALRYIKRETRRKYPLEYDGAHYKKCEFCPLTATEHHHNTTPIQVHEFNFVCHDCHLVQDYNKSKKEVKKE